MHCKTSTATALACAPLLALAQTTPKSTGSQTNFAPVPTKNPVGCNPETSNSPQQQFTVNYNFETVERGVDGLSLTNTGVYNLLDFNLIWLNTDPDTDGNHLGLAPHTYPDVAAFSANTDLLAPNPSITANYTESTISYFTPLSWWYGCVFPTEESAGSMPVNCNITAKGYDASGAQVASQVFPFAANGSVVQDMKYATFKGFDKIYHMEFSVTNDLTTAALVDNFIATLYQPSCAPIY